MKKMKIEHWMRTGKKGNDEPDDLMSKKDPFQVTSLHNGTGDTRGNLNRSKICSMRAQSLTHEVDLTLEQAIRIIQKNERGRIGIVRAQIVPAGWPGPLSNT